MGLMENKYYVLDMSFMMGIFSEDSEKAQRRCREFMGEYIQNSNDERTKRHIEFKDQKTDYRSERHIVARDYDPDEVKKFVCTYTGIDERTLMERYKRDGTEGKAIFILLLNRYCDIKIKDICGVIGNISKSRVSTLCSMGFKIIDSKIKYKGIIDEFIKLKVT